MRKLIELLIDEETDAFGVEAISLVKYPAIEHNWVFFSKDKRKGMLTLAAVDEEKKTIVGPALIPLKEIPRWDDSTDEEYDVYFSEETVVRASELFLKHNKTNEHTFEHETSIEGVSVVESWIVTDPEMDKSNLYQMEVPKGTWMVRLKVDNEEIWDEVKTGTVQGLSIEGYFVDRVAEMKRNDIQPQKKEEDMFDMIKQIYKRLKRTKMYAEVSLNNGKQLVTEGDSIELNASVYTLDDMGEPEKINDGDYVTDAEIKLTVADGTITAYDGEALAEDITTEDEEAITGDGNEELMSKYKEMYNKKLAEIQASKQNLSDIRGAVVELLDIAAGLTSSNEILYASDREWYDWVEASDWIAQVIDDIEGRAVGDEFRDRVRRAESRLDRY